MKKIREIDVKKWNLGDKVKIEMDHGPDSGWHTHYGFIIHIENFTQIAPQIVIQYHDERYAVNYSPSYFYIYNDYSHYEIKKIV